MSRLLEYLRQSGSVPEASLRAAQQRQQIYGGSLETVLLELGQAQPVQVLGWLEAAWGLKVAVRNLFDPIASRPWHRVPRELVDTGWAMPLAEEEDRVVVALHPEIPEEQLLELRDALPRMEPVVAPECCLVKLASERMGSVVPQRYAVLLPPMLEALSGDVARPRPVMRTDSMRGVAERLGALRNAQGRDQTTDAIVAAALPLSRRTVLFGVRSEGLVALRSPGSEIQVEGAVVPIPEGGVLERAIDAGERMASCADLDLRMTLGLESAIPCVFVPVRVRERSVLMLYLDRAGRGFTTEEVAAVHEICETAAETLTQILMSRSGRAPEPAPTPAVAPAPAEAAPADGGFSLPKLVTSQPAAPPRPGDGVPVARESAATEPVTRPDVGMTQQAESQAEARAEAQAQGGASSVAAQPPARASAVFGALPDQGEGPDPAESTSGASTNAVLGGALLTGLAEPTLEDGNEEAAAGGQDAPEPRAAQASRPRMRVEIDASEHETSGGTLEDPELAARADAILGDEAALTEALQGPNAEFIATVLARFPGPLEVQITDHRTMPPPSAHGPMLRAAIAAGSAVVDPLLKLFDHANPDTRFYAAFIFQELRDDHCVMPLSDRALDADERVRSISMRVLETYADSPSFRAARQRVRLGLRANNPRSQIYAARAVGTLRDVDAVPVLIESLTSTHASVAQVALQALCSITGQQLGTKVSKWRSWYESNRSAHRVEWIMSSLAHKQVAVRRWAADELTRVTGQDFGFPVDGDRRSRDAAIKQWRGWWEHEGASFR